MTTYDPGRIRQSVPRSFFPVIPHLFHLVVQDGRARG